MTGTSQRRLLRSRGATAGRNRDEIPARALELPGWGAPVLDRIPSWIDGRDLREGYRRGWGLQFGQLSQEVASSPLYQTAYELAQHPYAFSLLPEPRLQNLFLIVTEQLPSLEAKNIIEFGSFRGGTAIFLAVLLRAVAPGAKVYALDTFSGVPNADTRCDLHQRGDFACVDIDRLSARSQELGLGNLVWVKGPFRETFKTIPAGEEFGLAHIDCDVGGAVSEAERVAWPLMTDRGFVIFDDADASSCLGATHAVEQMIMSRRVHSEQVWPHMVFRAGKTEPVAASDTLSSVLARRRQTRHFSSESVPSETRENLLRQMDLAPSVGNSRPWRVVEIASAAARQRLKTIFADADDHTRKGLAADQRTSYEALGIAGFLKAPIQLCVFTDMEPAVGHRQGWSTFADALVHSTVGAIHTLWLSAEACGLGFAWVSTLEPQAMEAQFAQAQNWRFTAHVAIGRKLEQLHQPRHELTGWPRGAATWTTV